MQYNNKKMSFSSDRGNLTVRGVSSLEVKSDMALLNLGVTTEDIDLQRAQQENLRVTQRLLISLRDYGISEDNVYTRDIYIVRNYDRDTNELRSYSVTTRITIIIHDLSKLKDIYSLIIENGANDDIRVNFRLSNSSYYYNKALKKATQDALNKASVLAKNFGIKYNPRPYKIQEITSSPYPTAYSSVQSLSYQADIAPGVVQINAEIETVFLTYI